MRTFIISLVAASAVASCGTWPSQQRASSPHAAAGSGSDDNPTLVCHEESVTGSLLSQTVCRPVNDFDQRDAGGVMTDMQRSSSSQGKPGH
jgi:hypothetical protein